MRRNPSIISVLHTHKHSQLIIIIQTKNSHRTITDEGCVRVNQRWSRIFFTENCVKGEEKASKEIMESRTEKVIGIRILRFRRRRVSGEESLEVRESVR